MDAVVRIYATRLVRLFQIDDGPETLVKVADELERFAKEKDAGAESCSECGGEMRCIHCATWPTPPTALELNASRQQESETYKRYEQQALRGDRLDEKVTDLKAKLAELEGTAVASDHNEEDMGALIIKLKADVERHREAAGDRYSMPSLPGVLFYTKDHCRTVANVITNLNDEIANLKAEIERLKS